MTYASAVHDGTRTPGLYTYSPRVSSWTVRADKPVTYEIRFCTDVLGPEHTDLATAGGTVGGTRRRIVVIDENVELRYGDRVRKYFKHHDVDATITVIPVDETVKNCDTATQVIRDIDRFGIARRTEPIIAIGGGVLMDVVGMVSSLYRRGTPFIRVPTTLIGLVDAGVGVKTGVNFDGHKNRLGTYHPADLTLLDKSFLATLEHRHVSNGLAEILKMALIKDDRLFTLLEESGSRLLDGKFQDDSGEADEALTRAIHGMLDELQPNLWEAKLERAVDYGHTFSPTVEMRALPALLHGEAVCIDMAMTTLIAEDRDLVTTGERERIFTVMRKLRLPTWDPVLDPDLLTNALRETVRHRDGKQRLPLPRGIGDVVFVNDVTPQEIDLALARQRDLGTSRAEMTGGPDGNGHRTTTPLRSSSKR
ncbi:sedoheptulose 7-phosphate cyclase [Amycolatopsis jejuensis]|uniref:sedoheptulose 7-phosphate cyclase n=1 Tax=Amycolatopsis jejuensis TaxID=330084 RepID=UPI0005266FC0|nr:sedoheptulose 7-phosphate cyclase [Amycolatopsis jejuensis]